MKRPSIRAWSPFAALALLCCLALPVRAEPVTVQIVGAGDSLTRVLLATPSGDGGRAAALQKAITDNMSILPFVALVNPSGIPGGASVSSPSGEGVDFSRFVMAQVQLLITSHWLSGSQVELRCFGTGGGNFIFGNRYDVGGGEAGVHDVADRFCSDFLEAVIGRGDLFRSTLAFVKSDGPRKKDVWSVKVNGRSLSRLTNMKGEALSPCWSPDGGRIIFTHIDKRSHGLGVYNLGSKTAQRIKFAGNTVIGPAYMPDGRVAVSLSDGRNPSIFLLSQALQKQSKLEGSSAIDVSPSVDSTGSLMAFTSSRLGGPQVFLKDLRSGSTRRISQAGGYNTDPAISPDGTVVAFARQMSGGHRIFALDLVSGQEKQISFGPGSDEEPAFAPDGYFITFMSTRSGGRGLYLTTRNGGEAKRIPTGPGDAAFPAWSPAARR